jgi:hypothetical protein
VNARSDAVDPQLRRAFDALRAAEVPYVVLRGYDPITEISASVDVDIFIPAPALALAADALERAGWRRRRAQTGRYPHVFFDSWDAPEGFVRSIDVVTEICYGRELRALRGADAIPRRGLRADGVELPAPWDALVLLALHVLLDKGALSEKNAQRLQAAVARCAIAPEGREIIEQEFGAAALEVVDSVASAKAGDDLQASIGRARRLPVLRARPLLARWTRFKARLVQWLRPVARVAILGIDGSGKSTLITTLCQTPSTLRTWSGYLGSNAFRTPPAIWLERRLARYIVPEHRGSGIAHRILANLRTLWWPFGRRSSPSGRFRPWFAARAGAFDRMQQGESIGGRSRRRGGWDGRRRRRPAAVGSATGGQQQWRT